MNGRTCDVCGRGGVGGWTLGYRPAPRDREAVFAHPGRCAQEAIRRGLVSLPGDRKPAVELCPHGRGPECVPCALATGQAPAVEDAGAEEAEVFRREAPAGDAALLRDAERFGRAIEREARARRFRAIVDEAADRAGE